MVMCFVPDCKHYSEKDTCKFFTFPANPIEKSRWISLISRKDRDPSQHSLVCSCHFNNKDRKNRPTIFNVKRKWDFLIQEKRKPTEKIARVETITSSSVEPIAGPSNAPDVDGSGQSTIENDAPSCSIIAIESLGASLEAEIYFLKQDLEKEKLKNVSSRFSYEQIKNNDSHILMYTGIPTNTLFLVVNGTMESFNLKYYAGWNVKLLPKIDQLLMTLMKLRLNLPHEDLAIRFGCSSATVTNVVMTWIYALHEVFFNQLMKTIPYRHKNQACLPAVFSSFKNCRIILDSTELYSAVPTSMETQRLTFSSYKHRNTWKVLVGVSPNGVITYVSKAYPGSTSDKKIVEHCDILKQMVSGDLILADKGFLIKDLLPEGVSLNIPPFLTTPQFTEAQVFETERIAKARIHVERAIRRIKGFSIVSYVPHHYISQISIIVQLCAALTNFQYPLIKEVEEYYC